MTRPTTTQANEGRAPSDAAQPSRDGVEPQKRPVIYRQPFVNVSPSLYGKLSLKSFETAHFIRF